MSDDTGGPAFPQVSTDAFGELYEKGMTLRDYFAAHAMQGLLANPNGIPAYYNNIMEASFEVADAMLKARKEIK